MPTSRLARHVRSRRAAAFFVLVVAACSDPTRPYEPASVAQHLAPSAAQHTIGDPNQPRLALAPQTIVRSTGQAQPVSFTIAGYGPSATLHVVNGDQSGNNAATSASIAVDGVQVVGQSDFKKKGASFDLPLTIANPSTITVQLDGMPGSTITISVDAVLSASAPVTTSGGVVHLLGADVTLNVPTGALSSNITLTASPTTPPTPDVIPGTAIELGPTGTKFNPAATLTVGYDPSLLPRGVKPQYLRLKWWNVDHWETLSNNSVDAFHATVTATTTHFSTFALLPDAAEFCQSDPSAWGDLQSAIEQVPSGGTVYVCDGNQTVHNATIDRPLTIAAEHAGQATLVQPDTTSAGISVLTVSNVPAGTVAVQDMNIAFVRFGVTAQTAFDQLAFTGTSFTGAAGSNNGVRLFPTSVTTAKVTIDHDTFSGSNVGVIQLDPVDIDVTNSAFHDLHVFALEIFSANGSLNPSPTGTPAIRTARVLSNTFTNCGSSVCIAIEQAGRDTIRFNQISIPTGSVNSGILLNRQGEDASVIAPNVITDNTITGHAVTADSTVCNSWGVCFALRNNPSPVAVADSFARNTIDHAFVGLDVRAPTTTLAVDNHVTNTYAAMNYVGQGALIAHRDDFGAYHYPIASNLTSNPLNVLAPNPPATSLTCNYWGSAGGPAGVFSSIALTAYSLYSTVPIAGVSSVSCDPSAAPTAVRACPTPSSSGVPTAATISAAINAVAGGGTVLVCDGSWVAGNMSIGKAITIAAEGPGVPTIDAGGANTVFNMGNVPSGVVSINGLRLIGAAINAVQINANTPGASFSHDEFDPAQTNPFGVSPMGNKAGIAVFGSNVGPITVDNNTFIGGDQAIDYVPSGTTTLTVTNNSFSSQVGFTINVFGTGADIEHNTFVDCGNGACINAGHSVQMAFNTFQIHLARAVGHVISTNLPAAEPQATFTDNVITGIGAAADRMSGASYPVFGAISAVSGSLDVSRNQITNVAFAIASQPNGLVTGHDNIITTTFIPITNNASLPSAIQITRSDFTDYAVSISSNASSIPPTVVCNWWGSASGPIGVSANVSTSVYTPFATTPIANQSGVTCP